MVAVEGPLPVDESTVKSCLLLPELCTGLRLGAGDPTRVRGDYCTTNITICSVLLRAHRVVQGSHIVYFHNSYPATAMSVGENEPFHDLRHQIGAPLGLCSPN